MTKRVLVIGAGPAGLMAAETIARSGIAVEVFDAMPSVARKFLLAGKGGMNITHSEPETLFRQRYYGANSWVQTWLDRLSPSQLRQWIQDLGVETFIGSSGRVFPVEMKAAPLLRKWLQRLRLQQVKFHVRHKWSGWSGDHYFFDTPTGPVTVQAQVVVLALGGASWPALGSDAAWTSWLDPIADMSAFQPANCGFICHWSVVFQQKCHGLPLKGVCLSMPWIAESLPAKGELMIDIAGLEGGLIYAYSAAIRERIASNGVATIRLDLLPDRSEADIVRLLSKDRGKQSMVSHFKKRLRLDAVRMALLRECLSADQLLVSELVAYRLKNYDVELTGCFGIEKAISSAGGVCRTSVDEGLMLVNRPGVFCAGEMLDWEAPTGGYLLTACMASGRLAGESAVKWLSKPR